MYFDRNAQLGVVLFRNVAGGKENPDRLAVDILERLVTARHADWAATMARRIKDQTPAPGSEAMMRRIVDEVRAGKPDYDLYAPGKARHHGPNAASPHRPLVGGGSKSAAARAPLRMKFRTVQPL